MRGAKPPLPHGITHNEAYGELVWIHLAQDSKQVVGCCENGNERSSYIQRGDISKQKWR